MFRNWGERTSAPLEAGSVTRKSSVKAAPGATEDTGFSREQLGVGGEFCCCLMAAEKFPGVAATGWHDHSLTPSLLGVASQGPTSADGRTVSASL